MAGARAQAATGKAASLTIMSPAIIFVFPTCTAGKDVPAGTMAVVRSPDFLRVLNQSSVPFCWVLLAERVYRISLEPEADDGAHHAIGPVFIFGAIGRREDYVDRRTQ